MLLSVSGQTVLDKLITFSERHMLLSMKTASPQANSRGHIATFSERRMLLSVKGQSQGKLMGVICSERRMLLSVKVCQSPGKLSWMYSHLF
jgi:hypothetical protein